MIRLVVSENWKEEIDLHFWKMMKLERCIENILYVGPQERPVYQFPNGIQFTESSGYGRKFYSFEIKAHIEYSAVITNRLGSISHKSRTEDTTFKVKGGCNNKGEFLDLLWDIYSIGSN